MLKSSLGKKYLMAITGGCLVLFVLVHMIGNLLIYAGKDALNTYAQSLAHLGSLLWVIRAILFAIFSTHLATSVSLYIQNRRARPIDYSYSDTLQATVSSRAMVITGLMLLAFIVYHLLHFTGGLIDPAHFHVHDEQGRNDVFLMVVLGFKNIYISISYIVAMLLLGMHLRHGASSIFQTLGLKTTKYGTIIDKIGPLFATLIVLGNCSIPVAVLTGFIQIK